MKLSINRSINQSINHTAGDALGLLYQFKSDESTPPVFSRCEFSRGTNHLLTYLLTVQPNFTQIRFKTSFRLLKEITLNNNNNNKISSDMRSVPDLKNNKAHHQLKGR